MEISCEKFSELTINDVSDLLLETLSRSGEPYARALLKGKDRDGNVYDLIVCLSEGKKMSNLNEQDLAEMQKAGMI